MSSECQLITRPLQPTVTVRTVCSVSELPQLIGQVYGEIMGTLQGQFIHPTGAPFVAYFNMDMAHLDVEIGFPVSAPIQARERVQNSSMPEGAYIVTKHIGPYNTLSNAYDTLKSWMESQGHVFDGAAYEVYLNDPATTAPDQLLTEVMFKVRG